MAIGWVQKGEPFETFHMTDSSVHDNSVKHPKKGCADDPHNDPGGGGMHLSFLDEVHIQKTRVFDNHVEDSGNAGGIYCLDGNYSLDGLEVTNQWLAERWPAFRLFTDAH